MTGCWMGGQVSNQGCDTRGVVTIGGLGHAALSKDAVGLWLGKLGTCFVHDECRAAFCVPELQGSVALIAGVRGLGLCRITTSSGAPVTMY